MQEIDKAQKLISFVKNNLSRVSKMEKQLNIQEAEKLIAKFGFESAKIMLAKMDNWKSITKRVSVYLTAIHWFELDNKKPIEMPTPDFSEIQEDDLAKRKEKFEAKYPVGSKFKYNNTEYEVAAAGMLKWGAPAKFIPTVMFLQNSIFQI